MRSRRPDLRLVAGVAIVVASVAGTDGLVLSLDRTATAWAAAGDLVAGDVIRLGDLQPRPVRLDLAEGAYLVGDLDADAELVVLRPIGAGELVPVSALGDAGQLGTAVVVVPVEGPLASGLVPGASVDVWAAAEGAAGAAGAPVVIVAGAQVGRIVEERGLVGVGSGLAVEVAVPRDRIARILQALAEKATIALVPALPGATAAPRPAGG